MLYPVGVFFHFSPPQRHIFPVSHAGHMADETAVLIHNPYLDGRNPAVVIDADGLCTQAVTFLSARDEHHIAADAESQVALMIHQCGHCQVGQREEGPTLTHASCVQVLLPYSHLRHRMRRVYLGNPTASIRREAVGRV